MTPIAIGASIACSGCCLTVVEKGAGLVRRRGLGETLARPHSATGSRARRSTWSARCKLGDELGGHLVSGHVDGVGADRLDRRRRAAACASSSRRRATLARFIAAKGSIALDGVSLTVNEVEGDRFGVNIIPHTAGGHDPRHGRSPASAVNLEVDMLARYVARLLEHGRP